MLNLFQYRHNCRNGATPSDSSVNAPLASRGLFRRATVQLGLIFVLACLPSLGSQLSVSGYIRSSSAFLPIDLFVPNGLSIVGSDSVGPTSGSEYSFSHTEFLAAPGMVGLGVESVAGCDATCFAYQSADASMTVNSNDTLYISGATDGIMKFTMAFRGNASASPGASATAQFVGTYSAGYGLVSTSMGPGNSDGSYFEIKDNEIVFHGSSIGVNLTVTAATFLIDGPNQYREASADFIHTGLMGGVQLFALDGVTPLTGATITSDSGHDYTQAVSFDSVPEPGTLLPVAAGLVFLVRRVRKQRRDSTPASLFL